MAELTGKAREAGARRIVELLGEAGALLGEPSPVRHVVKFYEYGQRPLEVVSSRQWFVRTLELKDELARPRPRARAGIPAFMGARYASWVEGLN